MKRFSFRHPLILGTAILTASGLFCRVIGFAYRIFLSRMLGAEGLGIYQLVFPVLNLTFALCCAGFSTAISRNIAAKREHAYLKAGMLLSLSLALLAGIILYRGADYIADTLILEPRCVPLLHMLALSVPFSAAHSCLCGYYYGVKLPGLPAAAQIIEQLTRVTATTFFWIHQIRKNSALLPQDAICGVVISETVSALFLWIYYLIFARKKDLRQMSVSAALPSILHMALPLTGTRLMLSGLSSLEAILIPLCLRNTGMSASGALEIYGIITGMVLPFLTFPSALTNSAAVMLLPEVAEAQAKNQQQRIRRTASVNLAFCSCLGAVCTLFFLATGRFLGQFFYSNETAGGFLVMLSWLCPFLYLATTLGSILNGLGYTGTVFFHNILCALLRLGFIWFLTPYAGIQAWLWGMLAGEVVLTVLHFVSLSRRL